MDKLDEEKGGGSWDGGYGKNLDLVSWQELSELGLQGGKLFRGSGGDGI